MQLQINARHASVSDEVRTYAEQKLAKLDRRLHDLTLVELTLGRERNPSIAEDHSAEAIVHTKGPTLVASETAVTYEAAIDKLLDKLERQVERYRDKRTKEIRRRGPQPDGPVEAVDLPETEPGAEPAA